MTNRRGAQARCESTGPARMHEGLIRGGSALKGTHTNATRRLVLVFGVGCSVLLLAACKLSKSTLASSSTDSRPELNPEQVYVFCWFVEDNGVGGSGYAFFSSHWSRPLRTSERLFSSTQEVRSAFPKYGIDCPIILPTPPGWVPEGWKVRELTQSEFNSFQ